ncbi:MAG TPA: xanthine dehydrogenase family protein subunit M [Trinickia sp.]|jgi:xanthine dehydrogenase YagS FAD-binding subunit|uniref:FAD binding domain-containing protein n=1 Tax=Trinickia sp. TaxID=2571163 RepID=UPI002BB70684|nr:xanthine dehydrogenase family protein subunit M [Trinickia sp.]HTI17390.1 xanthine dehydrogenase family protein subunit M [Trinickia sp.]
METFQLKRASDVNQALDLAKTAAGGQNGSSVRFLAGGTTLLDLMKLGVEQPAQVIDIHRLPLAEVEKIATGGVKIGATVRNSDLANHPLIKTHYPVLSEALLSGASAQLRNMATTGGNLLQRTRCVYFRDPETPCNKREPGSGCSAIDGFNRNLAILGTSDHCIATNPSDMSVAMTALEATIHTVGEQGTRSIAIDDFFLLPGSTPERETTLNPGELITHVTLPAPVPRARSTYLKLRDRASYEFALASAAVVVAVSAGRIDYIRIAMGGVGVKPWRAKEAEAVLQGRTPDAAAFQAAAEAALQSARPQSQNGYKVELAKRCIQHALKLATQNA